MKLMIKEYLASLKERGELDVIIPDLLSHLGLNVFSKPGRGTRQDGVDVAAVGKLCEQPEAIYLFSIKEGDLTRSSWDGKKTQSLRPSLNEILDTYIPNRLPKEYLGKQIIICMCFGGDIQEQVRPQVEGYIERIKKSHPNIKFEEWNGDKLAQLILSSFMREDLFPSQIKSYLRKSLALIDEPEVSSNYFRWLIDSLSKLNFPRARDADCLTAMRQISICLGVLFTWSRNDNNLESAYLSAEIALLYGWNLAKKHISKKSKISKAIYSTFLSIYSLYIQICDAYLFDKIFPHVGSLHALSVAVRSPNNIDANLKMFDVLGRIAIRGLFTYQTMLITNNEDSEDEKSHIDMIIAISNCIKKIISNNPTLLLPLKDDQAIDISMALLFLALNSKNHNDIKIWLNEMADRSICSYKVHGAYPCNLNAYDALIQHAQNNNDSYRHEVTSGSILYPLISLWAAILNDFSLYKKVQLFKKTDFEHCNFQIWYPDETSEEHFYTNSNFHGATLSHVGVHLSPSDFIKQAFSECEALPYFEKLSAVADGKWHVILVACRHYRIPLPIKLMHDFFQVEKKI